MQAASAHGVVQTSWILTLCNSAARLVYDSLPWRRSSSDQSTSILFLTMLPCFDSSSKPFASTSVLFKDDFGFAFWSFSLIKVFVPVSLNVNSVSSPLTVLSYFTLFKAKDKMHHVSEDLFC